MVKSTRSAIRPRVNLRGEFEMKFYMSCGPDMYIVVDASTVSVLRSDTFAHSVINIRWGDSLNSRVREDRYYITRGSLCRAVNILLDYLTIGVIARSWNEDYIDVRHKMSLLGFEPANWILDSTFNPA